MQNFSDTKPPKAGQSGAPVPSFDAQEPPQSPMSCIISFRGASSSAKVCPQRLKLQGWALGRDVRGAEAPVHQVELRKGKRIL